MDRRIGKYENKLTTKTNKQIIDYQGLNGGKLGTLGKWYTSINKTVC